MEYEWDDAKNEVNIEKQGIGFEAVHGFEWDTAVVKPGDRRGEVRWAAVGYIAGRLHRVIYTERGSRRRIISLHKANARERGGDMSNYTEADLDRLPFTEYARIVAERGAREYGGTLTFDELAAGDLTFAEIETQYGEETAINAGIARDPDNPELTAEDFAQMRPATEVAPHIVEEYRRTRGSQKTPTKVHLNVRLDADIVAHLRAGGKGWQTRLNDTLRKAVFGP